MAWQSVPVPRLEGVSQEQFVQHLYPQVSPSLPPGGSRLVSRDPVYGEEAAGGWGRLVGSVARGEDAWG